MATSALNVDFHSIPVQTDFAGTTDVYENFTSVIEKDPIDHNWHVTLRGRNLVGQEVCLPDGYAVALVEAKEGTSSPTFPGLLWYAASAERERIVDEQHDFFVQTAAPSFVLWEHDQPPAGVATVSQWIVLSSLIHASEESP
jgi:hypothetical protein